MPDIRYACFSDMHFGADNSILTNLGAGNRKVDPSEPPAVLCKLVECLRKLIPGEGSKPPQLILNGDIFEFALSEDNDAAMAFQHFLELTMPKGGPRLFANDIIYIPGNHDHHLWESTRERQYAEFLRTLPLKETVPVPWHTTNMLFQDKDNRGTGAALGVGSPFFEALLARYYGAANDIKVRTVYPNYGLLGEDGKKLIIFTHGHFTENIYMLMTTLAEYMFPNQAKAQTTWEWEAQNFAWIDFFWSAMGRSGAVGADVGLIYEIMQDPKKLARFVGKRIRNITTQSGSPFIRSLGFLAPFLARHYLTRGVERSDPTKPLSDNGAGLLRYLETPVRGQLNIELQELKPEDITVIFGHTHKPFQQMMTSANFLQHNFRVYNSGGWVVDRPLPQKVYGGAVILLDESLNALSLRMYNESITSPSDYKVTIEAVRRTSSEPNPLLMQVSDLIDNNSQPWSGFSQAVQAAVALHCRKIKDDLATSNY